jgi:hypothetical protein
MYYHYMAKSKKKTSKNSTLLVAGLALAAIIILFCWQVTAYTGKTHAPLTSPAVNTEKASVKSNGLTYIALGKVPATGLEVGATFYGALATPVDGKYVISNLRQGGSTEQGGAYKGYDDNGIGSCGGKYEDLTNKSTWAENGSGDINNGILGNLPCGTKLAITYHGHTVIAEKADASNGGCKGTECPVKGRIRAIDLWWQTAKALCFSDQPDLITIHIVPQNTPPTTLPAYSPSDPNATNTCN